MVTAEQRLGGSTANAVVQPGSGHNPHVNHPDQLLALIDRVAAPGHCRRADGRSPLPGGRL